MKAITYSTYGTPTALALVDVPEPKVGPGEVLVRVRAAGVNPVDWKLAAGFLGQVLEVRHPVIPGWDVAGTVEAVGPDTDDYAVGDEVYGYVRKEWVELGTYAELVSAPVRTLARKPRELTFEQAAGLPLAGLTSYQAVSRAGVTGLPDRGHPFGGRMASARSACRSRSRSARGSSAPRAPATTTTCARSAPNRCCTGTAWPSGCGNWPPRESTWASTSTARAAWSCSSRSCGRAVR